MATARSATAWVGIYALITALGLAILITQTRCCSTSSVTVARRFALARGQGAAGQARWRRVR